VLWVNYNIRITTEYQGKLEWEHQTKYLKTPFSEEVHVANPCSNTVEAVEFVGKSGFRIVNGWAALRSPLRGGWTVEQAANEKAEVKPCRAQAL